MAIRHGNPLARFLRSIIVCVFVSCLASSALAASRPDSFNAFLNLDAPASFARTFFSRGGYHSIGGGVSLQGQAQFFLERGSQHISIPASDIRLSSDTQNRLFLEYAGERFELEAHRGIACPLGTFVSRDGVIAYTIPPDTIAANERDARERMSRAGLVNNEIAREFHRTVFASLVEEADFADVVPLPDDVQKRIIQSINSTLGTTRTPYAQSIGSYINTDNQVTYRVFLRAGARSVDVAGVPLRYSWTYAADGSALVHSVTIFSQDWDPGARLADLSAPMPQLSQYDFVNLYQVAGVFRQMHMTNPNAFQQFVATACSR